MGKKNTFDSPDSIQLKGEATGVKRLSKSAKLMLLLVVIGFVSFIVYAIYSVNDGATTATKSSNNEEDSNKKTTLATADVVIANQGNGQANQNLDNPVLLNSTLPPISVSREASGTVSESPLAQNQNVPNLADANNVNTNTTTQKSAEELAMDALKEKRKQQRDLAKESDLEVMGAGVSGVSSPLPTAGTSSSNSGVGGGVAGLTPTSNTEEQDDLNKQIRKERFLKDAESQTYETYLKQTRQPILSPFEIKAGWSIPAVLECGINTDLPAQICARVRENVYDTKTGRYLLIPQGSKLIGTYDSQVAIGQERILAVWQRLIFPDGSSISLQGMPSADQAGYGGFDAKVNNHYLKVFGGAFMLSMISAGIQLSQPQQQNSDSAPTTQQTIAGSLGQQLGQVGTGMVQRNMQIQPTLTQKAGYRFNIMITRDIVFSSAYRPM